MSGLQLDRVRFLSFDCYGTLIDWEAGILGALRPLLEKHDRGSLTDGEVLELFARFESPAQQGGYMPYRAVLRTVIYDIASALGFGLDAGDDQALVRSLADWPAFPDTAPALQRMAERWPLAILSNIDNDLFDLSRPNLGVDFAHVVTAADVQGYKPGEAHFREFLARAKAEPSEVLHIAQSRFHDVDPAGRLGFQTLWVDRRHDRPGAGATPVSNAEPNARTTSLAEAADLILGDAT